MTVIYECDRCHVQTLVRDSMMEITSRVKYGLGEQIVVRHYCHFCSLMMNNDISIVNNGVYAGSLDADKKIGEYYDDLKDADPLFANRKKVRE